MSTGRLKIQVYGAGELMPGFAVFDSVSQGKIQMAIALPTIGRRKIPAAQFFSSIPFSVIPLAGSNTGMQLGRWLNKSAFEELPKDLQTIVKVAARAINQDMLDEYTTDNVAAHDLLVKDGWVELRGFSADVLTELEEIFLKVIEVQANHDPLRRKVYDADCI